MTFVTTADYVLPGTISVTSDGNLQSNFPAFVDDNQDTTTTVSGANLFTLVTDPDITTSQAVTVQAQFEPSAVSLLSGGAAVFGAINNTNSPDWDGYGTLHILNTPIGAAHPKGTGMWVLLRGGEGNTTLGDTSCLSGVGVTNEMGHFGPVTFDTDANTVLWANHRATSGKRLMFEGAPPNPVSVSDIYFVKDVVNSGAFTIAATLGGPAIDMHSPFGAATIHMMQNPDRAAFFGNGDKYNSFKDGIVIGGAMDTALKLGAGDGNAANNIPDYWIRALDAAGNVVFSVDKNGVICATGLRLSDNKNTATCLDIQSRGPGGHWYRLESTDNGSGLGGGKLAVYDLTAALKRAEWDSAGVFTNVGAIHSGS